MEDRQGCKRSQAMLQVLLRFTNFRTSNTLFWQFALSFDSRLSFDILELLDFTSCIFTVLTADQGEEGRVRSCGDP